MSWKGRAMKLRRKNSRSYETAVLEQSEISSDVVLQRRFELRKPRKRRLRLRRIELHCPSASGIRTMIWCPEFVSAET